MKHSHHFFFVWTLEVFLLISTVHLKWNVSASPHANSSQTGRLPLSFKYIVHLSASSHFMYTSSSICNPDAWTFLLSVFSIMILFKSLPPCICTDRMSWILARQVAGAAEVALLNSLLFSVALWLLQWTLHVYHQPPSSLQHITRIQYI